MDFKITNRKKYNEVLRFCKNSSDNNIIRQYKSFDEKPSYRKFTRLFSSYNTSNESDSSFVDVGEAGEAGEDEEVDERVFTFTQALEAIGDSGLLRLNEEEKKNFIDILRDPIVEILRNNEIRIKLKKEQFEKYMKQFEEGVKLRVGVLKEVVNFINDNKQQIAGVLIQKFIRKLDKALKYLEQRDL